MKKLYLNMIHCSLKTKLKRVRSLCTNDIINDLIMTFKNFDLDGKNDDMNNKLSLISIDINKLDDDWKNSNENQYISRNFSELENQKKYICSLQDIINNDVLDPPIIDIKDNFVYFENGRHRFSNLRDIGVKTIPILVYQYNESAFKKYIV